MNVYVLSILLNAGTDDCEYDAIAVCGTIDKCKEMALEKLRNLNHKYLKQIDSHRGTLLK